MNAHKKIRIWNFINIKPDYSKPDLLILNAPDLILYHLSYSIILFRNELIRSNKPDATKIPKDVSLLAVKTLDRILKKTCIFATLLSVTPVESLSAKRTPRCSNGMLSLARQISY